MTNTNKIIYNEGDLLGEGGFAEVCKGRYDGKDVAVKKIQIRKCEEAMYAREEGFLTRNKHPNILEFFHKEQDDNCV